MKNEIDLELGMSSRKCIDLSESKHWGREYALLNHFRSSCSTKVRFNDSEKKISHEFERECIDMNEKFLRNECAGFISQ